MLASNGKGQVTISDFVSILSVKDPQEGKDDATICPHVGPRHLLVLHSLLVAT